MDAKTTSALISIATYKPPHLQQTHVQRAPVADTYGLPRYSGGGNKEPMFTEADDAKYAAGHLEEGKNINYVRQGRRHNMHGAVVDLGENKRYGVFDCFTSKEKFLYFILGLACIVYTIAVGIYICYVGGIGAKLTAKYYDYSKDGIAIDAFPRDIYKNTKTYAIDYILCSSVGLLGVTACIVFYCFIEKETSFMLALGSMAITVVPTFCYSAFITWKIHDLKQSDIDTWNSVDPLYIENLNRNENVMYATVVPGTIMICVICIIYCRIKSW